MVRPKHEFFKSTYATVSERKATTSKPSDQHRKRNKHDDSTKKRAEKEAAISAAIKRVESKKITHKRITLKRNLGLYATGKLSSTVWKEYCEREDNVARANEDLKKIVRLAESESRSPTENITPAPEDDRRVSDGRHLRVHSRRLISRKERELWVDSSSTVDRMSVDTPIIMGRPTVSSTSVQRCSSSLIGVNSSKSPSDVSLSSPESSSEDFEQIARVVNEELSSAMNLLFPHDEDIAVNICHRIKRRSTERSSTSMSSKDTLDRNLFVSPPSLTHEWSSKGDLRCTVEEEDQVFESSEPEESIEQIVKSTSRTEPSRYEGGNILDMFGDYQRTTTRNEMVVDHRVQLAGNCRVNRPFIPHRRRQPVIEQVRRPVNDSRAATLTQVDRKTVSFKPAVSSFPPQTFYNRRETLLRLQDPNDKDILDHVDTMRFESTPPPMRIRLIEASPDSDGAATFLPEMMTMPSAVRSDTEDGAGPIYFRHKLY